MINHYCAFIARFVSASLFTLVCCAKALASCDDIQMIMDKHRIPSFSVAFIDGDKQLKTCNTGDDLLFEAASLSKPVFAIIIIRLIEMGYFSLDTKIHTLLKKDNLPPEYAELAKDPRFSQLSVRHILSHSSGLPNWRNNAQLKFKSTPGQTFTYSGEAYELLQKIVERLTHKSIEQLAIQWVFQPAGMTQTSYIYSGKHLVRGHNIINTPLPRNGSQFGSSAFSLVTSSQDYLKFLTSLVSMKLISKTSFATLVEPNTVEFDEGSLSLKWGLGVALGFKGKAILGHTGSNPGFKAFAFISFDGSIGAVYLSNSERGSVPDQWLARNFGQLPEQNEFYKWLECSNCEAQTNYVASLLDGEIPKDTHLNFDDKLEIAYGFAEAGRLDTATRLYNLLDTERPADIEIYYGRSIIALQRGEIDKAVHYLKKVIEMDPKAHNARIILDGINAMGKEVGKRFFLPGYTHLDMVYLRGDMNHWHRFSMPMKKTKDGWFRYVNNCSAECNYTFYADNSFIVDGAANTLSRFWSFDVSTVTFEPQR